MPGATPSQTIGPFFVEALRWAMEATASPPFADPVQITGRVLDADGHGIDDALLEIWQPDANSGYSQSALRGFQRVATDADGAFAFWMPRLGGAQHYANVTLFARGLLRGVYTRVYLQVEEDSSKLNIHTEVSIHRLDTLLARAISSNRYKWDIVLRGAHETVFFEI